MPQVTVNPEQLRTFMKVLKQSGERLRDMTTQLQTQHQQLSQTWNDVHQKEFAEQLARQVKVLHRFYDESQLQLRALEQKATPAENYLHKKF